MGLYDRDYTQENFQSGQHHAPHMRIQFPRITSAVKWLLIINIAAFISGYLIPRFGVFQLEWFSVWPETFGTTMQVWRFITYQFLHGGLGHIFMNMFILYFFGTMIENFWGSRKFLTFYLVCGTTGGIFYPILAHIGWLPTGPLIGASGSILGMLAAAAILFPRMVVYVFGVFPLKMYVLAIILLAWSLLSILRPDVNANAGGEAAHLGGMCAGAIYVLSERWRQRLKMKVHKNIWESRMTDHRILDMEVDRILKKVHDKGMHSLTYKEKKVLKQATKAEQMRNKF
ncbi:MAG: rhomboid family intramembrane serine protease [Planctomycetes bacterium]|nr:rhomboid family intramembrane serine protease [Planctomycetota bacterium]MBL7146331.1 rhomboid family intramembrane serine protease [Phycisphaerae bacterium]